MATGLRNLLCFDTVLLPVYLYCLSKLILKLPKNQTPLNISIITIARLLLTIILSIITTIALITCAIWTDIVRNIGMLYFGDKFVLFASNADTLFSSDKRNFKGVIPIVCYVEEKSPETLQLLTEHIKTCTRQMQQNHPRLQCIQKIFLGYLFFLKEDTLDLDFITFFDSYQNQEDFQRTLNTKIASALPLNNEFLWDITIGRQAIPVRDKQCIPVLFRIHHSVGDGITLMTLLTTNYIDNGCESMRNMCDNTRKMSGKHREKMSGLSWNSELYFGFDIFKDGEKVHNWHGDASGHVSLKSINCDKDPHFIGKIKEIRRILNVSFNDVILGSVGAAYTKYFIRNHKAIPSNMVTANPYNFNAINFNDLVTFNAENKPITNLGNRATAAMFPLPLGKDYLHIPKNFIVEQNKITNYIMNSLDIPFLHWVVSKLVSITPANMIVLVNGAYRPSTIVTNLPPLPGGQIIGHQIVDITWSSVHYRDCLTCIGVYSYDGHFHVSTMTDSEIINEKQQIEFGDDIVQFVNDVYNDVKNY